MADEAPGSSSIVISQYHLPVIQPRVALVLLHGPVVLPVPVRLPLDRVMEASVLFGSHVITGLRVMVVDVVEDVEEAVVLVEELVDEVEAVVEVVVEVVVVEVDELVVDTVDAVVEVVEVVVLVVVLVELLVVVGKFTVPVTTFVTSKSMVAVGRPLSV